MFRDSKLLCCINKTFRLFIFSGYADVYSQRKSTMTLEIVCPTKNVNLVNPSEIELVSLTYIISDHRKKLYFVVSFKVSKMLSCFLRSNLYVGHEKEDFVA